MVRTDSVLKYGDLCYYNVETEPLRSEQCMCLNCGLMDVCKAAKKFYKACKEYNVALMVTRCRDFAQVFPKRNNPHEPISR